MQSSHFQAAKAQFWDLLERHRWVRRRRADMTAEEVAFVEAAMQDAPGDSGATVDRIDALLAERPALIRSAGNAALTAAFVGARTDAVVARLVVQGARFEYDDRQWSPLHHAAQEIARHARPDFARFRTVFHHRLAAATAIAVNAPHRGAPGHRSLLHITASFGHPDLTELLLNHGAATVIERQLGRTGPTALQLATRMNHWRERREHAALVLLAHGAHYDIFSACARNDGDRLRELLREDGDAARQRNGQGETPLHWAAWCGAVECVEQLLDAGALVNAPADNGKTPLHFAAGPLDAPVDRPLPDNTDVVRVLVGKGASLDAGDQHARTPLHHATFQGYGKVAQALLEAGANPNLRNARGKTALEVARKGAAYLRQPAQPRHQRTQQGGL